MKAVIIHPPVRSFYTPSSAAADISGYLKSSGYSTIIKDLNVDFYNEILTDKYVEQTYNLCMDIYNKTNKSAYNGNNIEQILKYFNPSLMKKIQGKIEIAKNILCSKDFYDPVKYRIANFIIAQALFLISLPYSTWVLHERSIVDNKNGFSIDIYKKIIKDKNNNIFYPFMETAAKKIIKETPDAVFILDDIEGQFIAAFTLGVVLKEMGQKNIILFGNYIPLISNDIKSDKTFFEQYADFMIYENNPVVFEQMLEYISNKRDIHDVNNLLYTAGGKIIENKYRVEKPLKFYLQDFEFIKDSKYIFPEIILPLTITDGCYWGKCKFCDLFSSKYTVKNIDGVIEEIKSYKKLYGARYFFLRDLSFSPDIAEKFADKLIKNKLDISYATFCRFEDKFDRKLLKLLHKSGVRCLNWGLESGSQKILDFMNKGIDLKTVSRILKDCYQIGIGNKISIIYGFPKETFEDFQETVNFILKHKKYIFSIGVHEFFLKQYSYIYNHIDEFGLRLNTTKTKWEYTPYEINPDYNPEMYTELEKLHDINNILRGGYDEILLYMDKSSLYSKRCCHFIFNLNKRNKLRQIFS